MKIILTSGKDNVIKRTKSTKTKWLHLRITQEEYEKLQNDLKETTCHGLSEYIRNIVFNRPVTVVYRNKSADEFLQVAIELKNELNATGKNFNQTVKRIHEIRHESTRKDDLNFFETTQYSLHQKVNEIKYALAKIYERLQEQPALQKPD
jgi:hypothetical protein